MMTKIRLERLLVESSKLQDHRQQSCVIRNVTVESVGSPCHRVKTNVDDSERSSLIAPLHAALLFAVRARSLLSKFMVSVYAQLSCCC